MLGRSGSGNFDPYKPMIGGQTFDERRKERNLSSSSSSEQVPNIIVLHFHSSRCGVVITMLASSQLSFMLGVLCIMSSNKS